MVRINSINSVVGAGNFTCQKTSFKGNETQTNPQIEQLAEVRPDYWVKTPISYSKTGEINFPYDTKAHCYKLANGQKVIIVPQEGETVLKTYVNTGSMNEPDNLRGISHYIEHNLFNGSEGLEEGDFFKQVEKMGASTNASTGFAETDYYIKSNLLNDGDLENKIKLHASMLETPRFAVEKLEKEKGIVNSEINMIVSNAENIGVNKMLKNLYGIKSTSVDMIGGTTENITNLTRDDVVNYFNTNYYPSNMVTIVTGDVNPDETIRLVSKYFTSKKVPSAQRHLEKFTPVQKTVREDIISDKVSGTSIFVGFNGPSSDNTKDRIYMEAISLILTDSPYARIDKNLKKYNSLSSYCDEKISTDTKDGRAVIFSSNCTDKNSESVLKAIFNEIGNFVNNPPTDEEIQIVKKKMLKAFSSTFENNFATNNAIGTSILENNSGYLNDYEDIVNSMTSEDLVNVAKKYLDINKCSVALVHPASVTEEQIKQNYKNISFSGKKVSFTGKKNEVLNTSLIEQYNLPNNYRIIMQNSKTDNVKIFYDISTDKDVKARPSASIILSKMLNYGYLNKSQEECAKELALLGIENDFYSSQQNISAYVNSGKDTLPQAIASIKNVIDNPSFTEKDFSAAKNRLKTVLETSEKSANDKLNKELFKDLPEGYTKEDILNDLKTLTLDDVKALYAEIIKDSKGVVTISAPFDKNPKLKEAVFSECAKFNNVKEFKPKEFQDIYKPVEKTAVLTDVDAKNQAEIIQAYKYKLNGNIKDQVAVELLNQILGGSVSSRLFSDLREKEKLAYHVGSNFHRYENTGVFKLTIGTTTENKDTGEVSFDNLQKSINGFNKHINKIKTEKVTNEELENAKLALKNDVINCNHSAHQKNISALNGINSPYGITRENQIFKMIDEINADDILNAANYIFAGKPVYSIVATDNTLKANEEYLNKLVNM